MKKSTLLVLTAISTVLSFQSYFVGVFAQDPPKGQREAALGYRPVQKDVEIDIPTAEEEKQCEISLYDGRRGFIVTGPEKNTLRLFLDANGDGRVDQWSYFKNGIEVYRDIDSDGNGSADQFRWLNSAGSRWGVDTDGDRVIDFWKEISAEEVSREIVLALATNDVGRFLRVTLSSDELKNLQLGEALDEAVSKKTGALESGFASAVRAVALEKEAPWYQLNAVMPGLVPGGDRGNKNDLLVYENAIATVGSGNETRQISIGTLVKVGDGNWRAIDFPKPYEDGQYVYTFIPPGAAPQEGGAAPDQEVIALIGEYQNILAEIPNLDAMKRPEKYMEVIALMLKLMKAAATKEDQYLWTRQLSDLIMEATQRNELPQGSEHIAAIYKTVKEYGNDDLSAYVRYRQIMVDYFNDMFAATDELKPYTKWLENLEGLVEEYGKTETGVEVMMQLAANREMTSRSTEEPLKWYAKAAEAAPDKPIGAKAKGAIRRLTATGKEIPFKGTDVDGKPFEIASLKGNFVLVCFWDSRVADELPAIKAAVDKFAPAGLKAVGVNLDYDDKLMKGAVARSALPWPQLFAPGGLDSPPAVYWGIQATPYMILYGKDGKVLQPNVLSPGDLQQIMAGQTK